MILKILRHSLNAFIEDSMLSRGAAVAFFTLTSLAPLLSIIVAAASLFMKRQDAVDALQNEFTNLIGNGSAGLFDYMLRQPSNNTSSWISVFLSALWLVITASGAFGELQAGLNTIWAVRVRKKALSRLIQARAASMALVGLTAFLLIVSLTISATLSALGKKLNLYLPFSEALLEIADFILSYGLLVLLFASIYKILPDTSLRWRDVWLGAALTGLLFVIGKSLIGFYLGNARFDTVYGALGAPIIVALWIYYSTQIFFFGSEMSKAFAYLRGSRSNRSPGHSLKASHG